MVYVVVSTIVQITQINVWIAVPVCIFLGVTPLEQMYRIVHVRGHAHLHARQHAMAEMSRLPARIA